MYCRQRNLKKCDVQSCFCCFSHISNVLFFDVLVAVGVYSGSKTKEELRFARQAQGQIGIDAGNCAPIVCVDIS